MIHNSSNKTSPFAFSYGIQGQYRISKRVSAVLEFSGTTTFQDFDGYGRTNRLGDHLLSLTAGFTFHLGKSAGNELLMSHITSTGMNSSSIIPVRCLKRTAATPDNTTETNERLLN